MTAQGPQPYANTTAEPAVYFLGIPTLLRATAETTGGAFGLIEHLSVPPGFASPYHTHHLEDESFYVLEGELAVVCGDTWTRAGAGAFVFGPRGVAHGFTVLGDTPARMLLLCAPGGFEQFVTDLSEATPTPPDMSRLAQAADRYQVAIHGALPALPQELAAPKRQSATPEALNRRWIQAFNERDWDAERGLLDQEFRAHLSGIPGPLDLDGWAGFMHAFTTGFPDARITIDECIADGDTVATRWHLTGTHLGEFQGVPATRRAITFEGLEYNRVRDGRFVEHRSMFDNIALLRQIGAGA